MHRMDVKHIYIKYEKLASKIDGSVFSRRTKAQRIFNLQIMSWFIAKNVLESWNVNWNLMLSRLKGNSQIYRWNTLSHHPPALRDFYCYFCVFILMHRMYCARIKARIMDWVVGYSTKGASCLEKVCNVHVRQSKTAESRMCIVAPKSREFRVKHKLFIICCIFTYLEWNQWKKLATILLISTHLFFNTRRSWWQNCVSEILFSNSNLGRLWCDNRNSQVYLAFGVDRFSHSWWMYNGSCNSRKTSTVFQGLCIFEWENMLCCWKH